MSIIAKITQLLDSKKLSQKDLTDYLGIDKSTFSQWKNGKSKSYTKYITEIAKFLDTSPSYLMDWNDINQQIADNIKEQISACLQTAADCALEISDNLYASDPKYIVHYYSKLNYAGRVEATRRVAEMAKLDEYTNPDGESVQLTEKPIIDSKMSGDSEKAVDDLLNNEYERCTSVREEQQKPIYISKVAARNGGPPGERIRTQEEIDEIRSRPDADPDL